MIHGDSLRGRQDFRYDPTGRILASLPAQGSPLARELFAFDPAGNLLDSLPGKDGQPVDTTLGVVGDNRLRFYQDLHFEYDVHGNVTKRTPGNQKAGTQEVLDLTWNADHQLIESNTTRHGVTQATRYAYDPLGRRVSKSDAFGSTHYLWDGDLMVHSQRGARQALYIYEPGSFVPLATVQGAGEEHSTYWYQCDQIGAPLELTDEEGQVAWAADYRVWCEAVMRSVLRTGTDDRPVSARAWGSKPVAPTPPPPIEQPFRFQGQQFDEETGLHYNRFRYYDPVVGRFVSQHPIGLEGGINLFLNSNNTTGWIDPYGLAPFKPCPCTCKKILDNMKANGRDYGAKSNTAKDGHHIIQDAAAKTIPKYSYTGAPAIQLGGPSTKIGSEHYIATQIQREAGGGTYAAERKIGYKAIRKAGLTEEESKCSFLMHVDPYFNNLGVTATTPMRTVSNRR